MENHAELKSMKSVEVSGFNPWKESYFSDISICFRCVEMSW